MIFNYDEAFQASKEYFNGDELAAKVFLDKYALRNTDGELEEKTPFDMHARIAKELARVEAKKYKNPMTFEEIFSYLDRFEKIVPQGSVMFGCGNYYQYSTLSNCYVITPPSDSYAGIMKADEELVQISKRRGGVGVDISNIRPAKSRTNNAARSSTGIEPFMCRFSNSIREVGQGGRRGALMVTISVHHPEIIDFARSKLDTTRVTGANISIRLTDEFLEAVQNDTDYEQRWPVESDSPKISRMVNAREVWKEIIHLAWLTAEPGLLFWDNIIRESPSDCYTDYNFATKGVNPCSELILSPNDSCRLLAINLFAYVTNPFIPEAYFDYEKFYEDSKIAQRFMDDIVDLELESIQRIIDKIKNDPEPEDVKNRELELWINILKACEDGRRTGTGITALGDVIAGLGLKYGTDESIETSIKIYKTLKLACYRSSVDMAKELGSFPVWDFDLEKDNPFLLRIKEEDEQLYEDMKIYGRRNIAILTTAPTGSVSIETQTSSGIEPVFMVAYTRRKKINPSEAGARIDFTDSNGDNWQEFEVYHPKVKTWMEITGETDWKKSPYFGATAEEIDWKQRVRLQAEVNRHVDHAISSCLVKDTLIETDEGLFYLDELFDFDNFSIDTFRVNQKSNKVRNHLNDFVKLDEFYNNGIAKTYKTQLANGLELVSTINERVLVLNEETGIDDWKMISELEIGDRVKIK
jgi:ribonucleoside-diphosphate reductase alpha chain